MAHFEHDPDGDWAAKFSDRDFVRHDHLIALFSMAIDMYDERDYLSGDAPVAVTIGPSDAIDFPEIDSGRGQHSMNEKMVPEYPDNPHSDILDHDHDWQLLGIESNRYSQPTVIEECQSEDCMAWKSRTLAGVNRVVSASAKTNRGEAE